MINYYINACIFFEKIKKTLLGQPQLKIKLLNKDARIPYRVDPGSAGYDIFCTKPIEIYPGTRQLVPTGISLDIKDGFEVQVRSKSGLALNQGLMCLNSPGTVDQGYTGEIKVIIFNTNSKDYSINNGDKIAQAVLCPVMCGEVVDLINVEKIEDGERSDKAQEKLIILT